MRGEPPPNNNEHRSLSEQALGRRFIFLAEGGEKGSGPPGTSAFIIFLRREELVELVHCKRKTNPARGEDGKEALRIEGGFFRLGRACKRGI